MLIKYKNKTLCLHSKTYLTCLEYQMRSLCADSSDEENPVKNPLKTIPPGNYIYLSIYLPIHVSLHISIYLSNAISLCRFQRRKPYLQVNRNNMNMLNWSMFINLFVGVDMSEFYVVLSHLSIKLSFFLSVYLSAYLSVYFSVYLSAYLSINISIYPPIYIYLSI